MNLQRRRHDSEPGQVLVIVAVGMIVLIAMVGVVVDGGYAWGKQRETQNGADASAEAGAGKLAENLAWTNRGYTAPNGDVDVLAAVNSAGEANNIGAPTAYYTDFSGNLIDATGAVVADPASAAPVGNGLIPPGASGVKATGSQTFDTFLARVLGINQFTASAPATAIAGFSGGTCSAEAGCIVLPVTVPITVLGCDGQNDPNPVVNPDTGQPYEWNAPSEVLTIPLCKNGPGNVGWLDWTPTAGGTSELVDAITNPTNPALEWPGWYYVTSTGNVNSQSVESALRLYDGKYVQFPQFDLTCDAKPDVDPSLPNFGCPTANVGGNGSNQWYHLAGMSTFFFCVAGDAECDAAGLAHGAYVNGNNKTICDTGNGGTSCLAGRFKVISTKGKVSAAPGPNSATANVGVQLIK